MGRPYVIIGGFMSVDGKTAPVNRQGRLFIPLLSEELLRRLHRLRAQVDAVLVGVGTVVADNPKLTVRAVQGKNPIRIVLDSMASIPLNSEILKVKDAPTIVAVCSNVPQERIDELADKGVEVMHFSSERLIPIEELLDKLYSKGIKRLLVEGGSEVRWSFVRSGMIDELFVWINPFVWGGHTAPTLVGGEGYLTINDSLRLFLKKYEILDGTVILEYKKTAD